MIHSSNRSRNVGRIVAVVALALMQMAAGGAFAVTHTISSLPYTCSVSNDTVTLSGSLSASGRAITVNSGIRNVYIKGNGHTITFNTANSAGVSGTALSGPRFITIENLTLIQSGNASDNIGISIGEGDSTFLNNCSVHVRGYDSKNVFSGGTRDLRISYGNYTSYVTDFSRRDLFTAAAIYVDDGYGNNQDWSDPQTWRVWVRHITIDSCPHAAMYLRGGRIIVDSCDITVDAQVGYTYPSGNMYYGVANAYAIIADRDAYNSRIIGNTLRSGTNHLGGRGILIENSQDARFSGTSGYVLTGEAMEIAHNDINVHAGPDPYYGGSYQAVGLRIRNDFGFDNMYVHDNVIVVEADTASATNHTGLKACGMWFSGPGPCAGWRIENNQVTAQGKPGLYARRSSGGDPDNTGSYARAFVLDQDLDDGNNSTLNNRFSSNVTPVCFGEVNSWGVNSGENWNMCGDTIVRLSPDYSDNYNNDAAVVMSLYGGDAENNSLIAPRFLNDTTVAIAASESGPAELFMKKIVTITVVDKNGVPVENATVGMRDARGIYQVNGTTDSDGRLVDTISFRYYHWGIGSDTTYNPFVQYAKFATDSTGRSKSYGVNTDGADIIVLANTVVGSVVTDTIAPGTVGDLSALPAAIDGHLTFGWTSTGDDGASGTAASDSIRFSTSPLNALTWSSATRVARTEPPEQAGVADQVDISETAPVPGQFYYVGIKVFDEAHHASPLSIDSGFARGILTPQIVVDMTESDTAADQMTFYCATVRSYLGLNYDFQISSDAGFPSPLTGHGVVGGSHASTTFDIIAGLTTVYVRCHAVATDLSDTSAWSTVRAFTVTGEAANVPPEVPVAVSPLPGDTVTSLTVALSISNCEDLDLDPVTYQFELYDSAGSTRLAQSGTVSEGTNTTSWSVPSGIIQDRSAYRWTARAFDGQDYSAWMSQAAFTVVKLSADETPVAGVVRAYPNPVWFAGGGTVTFALSANPTDLTIMTVSGEIVLRTDDVADQYVWDGKNQSGAVVSTGLYLWFLSDGSGQGKLMVKPPSL